MSLYKSIIYNSSIPVHLIYKPKYKLLENQNVLIPRFKIKNEDLFPDFPINEPVKFSIKLILKAIEYGMIIKIEYKGEEDNRMEGHSRTIYPLAIGYSSQNKILIRAWHFNGWSVSQGTNIDKEWRLFRGDRILSMSFTGSFFRLAPEGYVMRDKSMSKILALADFNQIRKNQQKLLNQDKVDTHDKTILNNINKIVADNMNFILNIQDPWRQNVLKKTDSPNIRITFAKPVVGSGIPIAILGVLINPNKIFKLYDKNNQLIGSYKTIKHITNGEELESLKRLEDNKIEFKLYSFIST